MGISISNLIYTVLSLVVASFVLLFSIGWFVLKSGSKKNEHDEELFKQPPPEEDCPICFLRIPTLKTGSIDINLVVEKRYVVDVFMHQYMTIKVMKLIIKSVHFVELQHPRQRRWLGG